jgi:hypothetical protein
VGTFLLGDPWVQLYLLVHGALFAVCIWHFLRIPLAAQGRAPGARRLQAPSEPSTGRGTSRIASAIRGR